MERPTSVLYYPHIEFQSEAWVKASLLLWDHVYRIVPEDYNPRDSYEIRCLVDEGFIRDIKLTDKDREETKDEFLKLCDIIDEHMPAGLSPAGDYSIHPNKIDNTLYPYLDLIGDHFIDEYQNLHMSNELARGYMFKLSQVVARIRNLNRGTDDTDAWSINPYFCENANVGELLSDSTAEGFFCSVTLEDLIPNNIGMVGSRELVKFLKNRHNERELLRNKFHDMTNHLSKIQNVQHACEVNMDFINELLQSKEEYRKSMDSWIDYATIPFTTGIPLALNTLDYLKNRGVSDSLDNYVFGGCLSIGAIWAYANYNKAKKKRNPSYASYLIEIDHLSKNLPYYSNIKMDEFIND